MVHLLRSLLAGYAIALVAGFIATLAGASAVSVVVGVWLGGSLMSVLLAACFARFAYTPEELHASDPQTRVSEGRMRKSLTAKELAMWDQDLAAEQFEADMAADRVEKADNARKGRKSG